MLVLLVIIDDDSAVMKHGRGFYDPGEILLGAADFSKLLEKRESQAVDGGGVAKIQIIIFDIIINGKIQDVLGKIMVAVDIIVNDPFPQPVAAYADFCYSAVVQQGVDHESGSDDDVGPVAGKPLYALPLFGRLILDVTVDLLHILSIKPVIVRKVQGIVFQTAVNTTDIAETAADPHQNRAAALLQPGDPAILKLADALDITHKQKISMVKVAGSGGRLEFCFFTQEEVLLEAWDFESHCDFFEEVMGVRPVIKKYKG